MSEAPTPAPKERELALAAVVVLVALSVLKGYLHVDDASTVLVATVTGAVLGFYFGRKGIVT